MNTKVNEYDQLYKTFFPFMSDKNEKEMTDFLKAIEMDEWNYHDSLSDDKEFYLEWVDDISERDSSGAHLIVWEKS